MASFAENWFLLTSVFEIGLVKGAFCQTFNGPCHTILKVKVLFLDNNICKKTVKRFLSLFEAMLKFY